MILHQKRATAQVVCAGSPLSCSQAVMRNDVCRAVSTQLTELSVSLSYPRSRIKTFRLQHTPGAFHRAWLVVGGATPCEPPPCVQVVDCCNKADVAFVCLLHKSKRVLLSVSVSAPAHAGHALSTVPVCFLLCLVAECANPRRLPLCELA